MIAAFRASRARRRLVSATVVATLAAAALALTLLPSSFTNAQDPLVIEILGEVTDNYTTDQEEELEPVYRDWQLLAVALADH